jgi:hypothetical protein
VSEFLKVYVVCLHKVSRNFDCRSFVHLCPPLGTIPPVSPRKLRELIPNAGSRRWPDTCAAFPSRMRGAPTPPSMPAAAVSARTSARAGCPAISPQSALEWVDAHRAASFVASGRDFFPSSCLKDRQRPLAQSAPTPRPTRKTMANKNIKMLTAPSPAVRRQALRWGRSRGLELTALQSSCFPGVADCNCPAGDVMMVAARLLVLPLSPAKEYCRGSSHDPVQR